MEYFIFAFYVLDSPWYVYIIFVSCNRTEFYF